jgi:hypothetical protein
LLLKPEAFIPPEQYFFVSHRNHALGEPVATLNSTSPQEEVFHGATFHETSLTKATGSLRAARNIDPSFMPRHSYQSSMALPEHLFPSHQNRRLCAAGESSRALNSGVIIRIPGICKNLPAPEFRQAGSGVITCVTISESSLWRPSKM